MTGSAKRKGDSGEREIVSLFDLQGYEAHRVPLSGSVKTAEGRYAGDVRFTLSGKEWSGEVKRRAGGFKQDYAWLEEGDVLFKRADRRGWLVTLRLTSLFEMFRRNDIDRKKIEYADRLIKAHMTGNGSFLKILEEFKIWGRAVAEQPARDRIKERRDGERD